MGDMAFLLCTSGRRFAPKSTVEGSIGLGRSYDLIHGDGPAGESRLGDFLSSELSGLVSVYVPFSSDDM